MLVVVDADAQVEALEVAERIGQPGLEVDARLLEIDDGDAFVLVVVLVLVVMALFLVVIVVVVVIMIVVVVVVVIVIVVIVVVVIVVVGQLIPVLFVFVLVLVAVRVAVAGDAVLGVQAADRNADEPAVAHEGEADRTATHLEAAAGDVAVDFLLFLVFVLVVVLVFVVMLVLVVVVVVVRLVVVVRAVLVLVVVFSLFEGVQICGLGEPRDLVVVRLAGEAVEVPRHAAAATVEPKGTVLAVAVVGTAQVDDAAHALGHFVGDASGVHVHHAADSAGTVEQRAGALQDLHPLRDERVDRDGVVAARDRDVERVDAVFHDAYARAGEAMNDRASGGLRERAVVDARLVAHGRADAVGRHVLEFSGGDDGRRHGEPLTRQGMSHDDDLLDHLVGFGRGVLGMNRRCGSEAEHRQCRGYGQCPQEAADPRADRAR